MPLLRRRLEQTPIMALARRWPPQRVIEAATAARDAGIGAFEITLDSEGALEQIGHVHDELGEDLLVGAGTVVSASQARDARAAGADFVVSPHLDEDVVRVALGMDLEAVPGVLSPTELSHAVRLGATLVKLFPAAPLGTGYLRALRGPYPDVGLLATGGLDGSNAAAFLAAGATAVALGSSLFSPARSTEQIGADATALVDRLRRSDR